MLASVTSCKTVFELNAARRDLFAQVWKRGILLEEFDHGYENLFQHAQELGLKYHIDYWTYGPKNVEPLRKLLNDIRYSRFLKQFNQAAQYVRSQHKDGLMTESQFQMCWTMLLEKADFQGYKWNDYQEQFIDN